MNILSVSPLLSVSDLAEAIDFYCRVLGFDPAWSWGEPPSIAAVCRDGIEITLTRNGDAKPAGAAHIYLHVTDIDDYYASIGKEGAAIIVPIADRAYGMRDFRIADPSGNELSIGQAIAGVDPA